LTTFRPDEVWSFVGCKEKTRIRRGYSEEFGDCYTFTALERHTKLLITWHVGKRSQEDCLEFSHKLARATKGRFQLTTDGFRPYRTAVQFFMGKRVDFARSWSRCTQRPRVTITTTPRRKW